MKAKRNIKHHLKIYSIYGVDLMIRFTYTDKHGKVFYKVVYSLLEAYSFMGVMDNGKQSGSILKWPVKAE